MRKPLKKGVRNDWKSTIKLISVQRLNADSPVRGKKKKRFPFFALVLKLSLSRWNSFTDISLWTRSLLSINSWGYSLSGSFLISQLPQGSLCQDVDLYYLLSLPVQAKTACSQAWIWLPGYQSRLEVHQEEINSYSSPGSHKMALSDQTIFHLLT